VATAVEVGGAAGATSRARRHCGRLVAYGSPACCSWPARRFTSLCYRNSDQRGGGV